VHEAVFIDVKNISWHMSTCMHTHTHRATNTLQMVCFEEYKGKLWWM